MSWDPQRTGALLCMETTQNDEIEQLKEQVRQEHEMYLRALVDFDNYRRRGLQRPTGGHSPIARTAR